MSKIDNVINRVEAAEKELANALSEVTVDLFTEGFSYSDKDILMMYRDRADSLGSYKVVSTIDKALKLLKEKAYPEVSGAKYYKRYLDKLTVDLTKEEKKAIDDNLFKNYRPNYIRCSLTCDGIDYKKLNKVAQELYEMGAVDSLFEISFDCENCHDMSESLVGNVHVGDSLEDVLSRVTGEKTTIAENLESVYLTCRSCDEERMIIGDKEVQDVKDQFARLKANYFKIVAKPDMTLDEL